MTKDEFVVLRAKEPIRDRLLGLAKKRNQTLTAITDIALESFLDNNEFTFEDLLGDIATISSLVPSLETIRAEMKDCPAHICKQIRDLIKGKEVFFYKEKMDTIQKRIKELDKKNLEGIILHLTFEGTDVNKINEMLKKVSEELKGTNVRFVAGARSNSHENILLFVAYNKKEGEDGKK